MKVSDLLPFDFNSYCGACGSRSAEACFTASVALEGLAEKRPPEFVYVEGMENVPLGLIERDCSTCGYVWWELPLNSPLLPADGPEPPLMSENRALRRLIVQISRELDTSQLLRHTRAGLDAVLQEETGSPDPADDGESLAKAAPYFAPLRPDYEG